MEAREKRRMAGMFHARVPEIGLEKIDDRRSRFGVRWKLDTILRAVLLGLCAGCKGLAELEGLTSDFEPAMRKLMKIPRRVPDTTMRDALVRQHPFEIREAIFRQVRAARLRKALPRSGLPFHVAALDGRGTATPSWDHHYAQQKTYDNGQKAHGLVRTITVAMVSTPAKPVLDAVPVPAETNEAGIFPAVFAAVTRKYGNLIRLFTYDAGATSAENCHLVVDEGKDYLFRIKNVAWHVMKEATRRLGRIPNDLAVGHTEDVTTKTTSVHRYLFIYSVGEFYPGFARMPGMQTIVRVRSEKVVNGEVTSTEDRYWISSLPASELTGEQWLELVRNHWAVENACHWTFDAIFQEDSHPWIEKDPRGVVVMMLLRRIAYNMLALFRSVTLRSEEHRDMPWRTLMRWVFATLVGASELQVQGLRERKQLAVP